MMLKRFVLFLGSLLLLIFYLLPTHAQSIEYPTKHIRLIVPYNPGGGSDRQARIVEAAFKQEFGQSLVFVYKPGAGGAIGNWTISTAKADGYTIGVSSFPTFLMQPLTGKAQFTIEDFDYLAISASERQMFLTVKESKYDKLGKFIEDAKKNPGRLTVGVVSAFGPTYMDTYLLMDEADIKVTIVPFGGGAKGMAGLLGKKVDALFGNEGAVQPQLPKLNILGISSPNRHKGYPDVPTFKEIGYDIVSTLARIWLAPKGLDEKSKERLIKGLEKIYSRDDIKEKGAKVGQAVNFQPGDDLKKMVFEYNAVAKRILEKHGLLKK